MWRVVNVERANIALRRDTVRAAFVDIVRDGERRRLTVELSEAANDAGRGLSPESNVRPYLDEDDPPRRLVVGPNVVYPIEFSPSPRNGHGADRGRGVHGVSRRASAERCLL